MPYKVFLSYSWSNSAERRALVSEIAAIDSVHVLVDRDFILPGDSIHQSVLRMIEAADCVIVLLTTEGLKSREVLDEISRSHDRHKLIIPVVMEGTKLEDLPWYLRDLNWISYNERKFDEVVDTIVSTIKRRANPIAFIDQNLIPPRLRALIDAGTKFIDVPASSLVTKHSDDFLFCELKMRQTRATFVLRLPKMMRIGEAAEYIVSEILPHLDVEDYDWSLVLEDRILPSYHTIITAGIKTGDTIYLRGNHRRPEWAPSQ